MTEYSEKEIYLRLIEALKTAAGCCTQMAHSRKDARWIRVRALLEAAVGKVTDLATRRAA